MRRTAKLYAEVIRQLSMDVADPEEAFRHRDGVVNLDARRRRRSTVQPQV